MSFTTSYPGNIMSNGIKLLQRLSLGSCFSSSKQYEETGNTHTPATWRAVFYSLVSPLPVITRKETLGRDLQWLFLDLTYSQCSSQQLWSSRSLRKTGKWILLSHTLYPGYILESLGNYFLNTNFDAQAHLQRFWFKWSGVGHGYWSSFFLLKNTPVILRYIQSWEPVSLVRKKFKIQY